MTRSPFRPRAAGAATLSTEERTRIALDGLTPEELRGALFALDEVEKLARVILPSGEAHARLSTQPAQETNAAKVLEGRAKMAIMVCQATRRTLPTTKGKSNADAGHSNAHRGASHQDGPAGTANGDAGAADRRAS